MLIGSIVAQGQAKATLLGQWTSGALLLGNFSQALPFLIRQLWQPVHREHSSELDSVTDRDGLRSQLRQSMELYEHSVQRISQQANSTPDDVVSAITQLVHHGEGNTQFNNAAAARGLHVAVASLVGAHTTLAPANGKDITKLQMAQELLYSCLGYYLPDESGEPVPMLNMGDCRHSTSLIAQALSQQDPPAVANMLRTMIHAAGDASRVGSVTAAAMVRASLRCRFRGMTSKITNLPAKAGRRKTQLDRRFHATIKFANSLHRHRHPPPCLFQAMLPGAVATDLYHWNRMRIAHAENYTKRRSQAPVQQQHSRSQISESVGGSQGTQVAAHTGVYGQAAAAWTGTMPVAFLLSHEDSHTRRVLSMRRATGGQCISDRLAKELLGLTRSEEDVAQVLQGLIYPGVAEHPPFVWVDHASAALVSAAVTQYVIHQAWAPALRLLERAIKVDRQDGVATEHNGTTATVEEPFSVLDLQKSASKQRPRDPAAVAANTLLCATAAMAATRLQPASNAMASALDTMNTVLSLSQVNGITLSRHTVKQVFLCAVYKQRIDGKGSPSAMLHACLARHNPSMGWSTAAHALILAGDDGCHALSLLKSTLTRRAATSGAEGSASMGPCSVAAAYVVVRAPGVTLPQRLQRLRQILSALSASEIERFSLREDLARAAVAGFFQHANGMKDLSRHGLQLLLSELLAGGLPFTGHFQKCLARHMHVLSVALVRHRVRDAAALELKSAVGRLAVGDVYFAGSAAGRRCVSRAAVVQGQSASTVCDRSSVDDTPYYTDGRISSTGFAIFPADAEDIISECQTVAAGWLPPAGGDLGGLCRQMSGDLSPSPLTAEFLCHVSAATLSSVDWMAVAENQSAHRGADLLLPPGEERYLQQAMDLSPEQLLQAWHGVSSAARVIQANPPE